MRSRAPVLAAVAAVVVVQSVTGRGGVAAAPRSAAALVPPRLPLPEPAPVPSTAPPVVDLVPGRRRRRAAALAGAVSAPVLALALPAALPSPAALDPVASAAEPATAQAVLDDPVVLEAMRERVLADRAEAAEARARRARRSGPPPAPPAATPPETAAAVAPPAAAPAPQPAVTVAPVAAAAGSPFGPRWGRLHAGLDFPAPLGTPIVTVADGVVEQAGPASGYGNLVTVRHGDGVVTAYGHMRRILVTPGQAVHAGQLIAEVGSEGRSTGPHLHFEVRTATGKVNPRPWLASRGVPL